MIDDKHSKNLPTNQQAEPRWEIFGGISPLGHMLGRTLGAYKQIQEKEIGINGLVAMVLLQLMQQDGITQNYLTSCTRVDPSMITRIVKELEQERGWVRRERDPQDNRLMRVYLTDEGREQAQILPAKVAAVEQRLTRNLTEQDLQELRRILGRLEETVRQDYENSKDE